MIAAHAKSRLRWPLVALVGLRASGKSTLARALGAELGVAVVDLDDELAARHHASSAGDLLRRTGVARFRALESALALELLARPCSGPRIWSCGGGLVEAPLVRALLARRALVVWLDAPASGLAMRLRGDPAPRPSLLGLPPREELDLLARRREGMYRSCAHVRIDASASRAAVLEQALHALARHGR